jgi:hypothetical protein
MRAKPKGIPRPRPIPRDMEFGEFEGIEDGVDVDVTLELIGELVVIVEEEEEVVDTIEELKVDCSSGRSTIDPTGTAKALPFWQQVLLSVPQQYKTA